MSELNQKRRRIRYWPLAAVLWVVSICALAAVGASAWVIIPLAVASFGGVLFAHQYDLQLKTTVILYDLDSEMEAAFRALHESLYQLRACRGRWHVTARGSVHNRKYNAGADQLVNRSRLRVAFDSPPYVRTNIDAPVLHLGSTSLYFFPEHLLVFARNGVGAVSYRDLSIVVSNRRFIEEGSVPRDAEIVDHTWQIVNKSGGPDRRFNNNRQLPVCLYEEVWINSTSGLNELLQVSRRGIGTRVNAAVEQLSLTVEKKQAIQAPKDPQDESWQIVSSAAIRRSSEASEPASHSPGTGELYDALLEILCCVMVADGRASSKEKKCIHELMSKLGSPWSHAEVSDQMEQFILRVQRNGYRRTLAVALKATDLFKKVGQQEILLRSLEAVANADGAVGDRERQLCKQVRALME